VLVERVRVSIALGQNQFALAAAAEARPRIETRALRFLLARLREILLAHPRVTDDPARVRFVGFGASALELEVFAYVDTEDWGEFLTIREDLLLRFMDAVERSGSGFAFPSQTLYLGRDSGLDPERSRAAEAEIDGLRREGRLPFPDFGRETLDEITGRGQWPPAGSVTRPPRAAGGPGADDA